LFIAAVSGGADSTSLLSSLANLQNSCPQKTGGFRLQCLHVEHGIRPAEETRGDAEFVRSLCKTLDIPCAVVSIPPGKIVRIAKDRGIGVEAAARLFRHGAWAREMRRTGAARVLVAHTRDDLLETTLMRLLRGSGPAGLAAMKRDTGVVLRPMLSLERADVLAYLEERGIPFRTDSTNADTAYLRNRIRSRLVAVLNAEFPSWKTSLASAAQTQRMAADFLEKEASARIQWTLDQKNSILYAEKQTFFSEPEIIREEALFYAIDRVKRAGGLEPDPPPKREGPPKRSVVRAFCQGGAVVADAGAVVLDSRGDRVAVKEKCRFSESGFVQLIKTPESCTVVVGGTGG
jgi:tRNA(Ile)-lysidine synthase